MIRVYVLLVALIIPALGHTAFSATSVASAEGYANPNIATGAFTPTADALLITAVFRAATGDPDGVSGHGTWTKINHSELGSHRLSLYQTVASSSPSSLAVTVDSDFSNTRVEVFEITGQGASPIVQSATASAAMSSPDSITLDLAAYSSASNLGFVVSADTLDYTTYSVSGWTELLDDIGSTVTKHMGAHYAVDGGDPVVEHDGYSGFFVSVAFEVDAAAAGSAIPTTLRRRRD